MSYQSHYFKEVREAQKNAYAPYSNFKVGAYLKTKDGRCFYGANVENAAYPMGICAERSSLVSAISEGYQPGDFESITVTVVYMTNQNGDMIEATVGELLPLGFSGKDLN